MGETARAVAALVCNAFVWGVSWWPFRALHAHGVHPLWSTALVYGISLACVLLVRRNAWRTWRQQPLLWLLALAAGLTNVGFNWAVTVGDVVRVVLLFYLMPAWSIVLAWLLLKDKPDGAALVRLALALAGVAAVLHVRGAGWPWPRALPDWLALASGFCFALTNILLLKLQGAPAPARVLAMFGGGAAMAASVATFAGVAAPPALSFAWLPLALLLSAGFLVGNLCLQYGASRLPAHTTALVMLSEVVFASLSSVALGASQPGAGVWMGGLLILAAAAWSAWPRRQRAAAGAQ